MGCSVGGVRCSVGGGQNVVVDGTTEDTEYTEGDGVFWEGEVPSEPRHFCGSGFVFFLTTDEHRWARIWGKAI
jgi:hypothetical protein